MSDTADPSVTNNNAEQNQASVEPPLVSINKPETVKAAPVPAVR
jgi:hypothetical protein